MTGPAACRPRRRSARCVPLPASHALICAGCVCGRVVTSDGARWVILYLRSRHITPSLKSRSLRFHSPVAPSYPADRCNACVGSFCTCLVFVSVPTVSLSGISFVQVEPVTDSPPCTFLECKCMECGLSSGGAQWFCFGVSPSGVCTGGGAGSDLCLPTVHARGVGQVALSSQRPRPCRPEEAVRFCLPPGPQVGPVAPPLPLGPALPG